MPRKIKLAIVGFIYNHPTGIRNIKAIEELSKYQDIEIEVITVSHWDGYNDKDLPRSQNKNLRLHYIKPRFFSKISLQFRFYMKGLFKKLKQLNPDIIYIVNEPLAINTFLATIYAKILKKKVMCFTWENLILDRLFLIDLYENHTIKKMDHIVAGSKDAEKILIKKKFPKNKITTMPVTGTDTTFFRPSKKNICKRLNIKKENTCLFLGRLEDEKGIKYILEAKDILKKDNIDINLLFVGDGKWYNKLSQLSKKDSTIKIIKWLEYSKIPEIYNSASIFLYPSIPIKFWEEQFGYSMAEAMATGLPVIASNTTGPREIVKDNKDGFLIKSKDSKQLAEKIKLLITDKKLYKKMSDSAIKNIKRFDNKEISKRLHDVILKINSNKRK